MSCWPESSNGMANKTTAVYEQVKKAAAEHLASPEASKKGRAKADIYPLYDPASGRFAEGMSQDDISSFVGRSFAGTARTDPEMNMHWMLGPAFHKARADPERIQTMAFFQDRSVIEFGFESLWGAWHMARNIRNIPKLFTSSEYKTALKYANPRMDFMSNLMKTSHAEHAPMPHWAADADGVACYLETGSERMANIYTNFGYQVVKKYTLTIPTDVEEGNPPQENFTCMMRPAKAT
ncbi:hypothetical protein T484DRAFT_1987842 [Baffinella frigidus]|nr:hypothetical protein T484DRAFT_1987842 [Cryptophyta sp. CCMP2293]